MRLNLRKALYAYMSARIHERIRKLEKPMAVECNV